MPLEEVTRETSKGIQTGYMITVKGADFKATQKEWEKNIKNNKFIDILKKSETKVQFSHKGDEYIATNALINSISSTPISVMATITDIKEGVRVIAYFKLDSVNISSKNSKEETYLAAQNYLRNFGIDALKQTINDELDNEKEILKDFTNQLKKLRSKKDDYEKSIGKNKANIREMESSIKANLIDQDRQDNKVHLAKDTLHTFNRKTEEYKTFKGKLKDEQQAFKKLQKANKSYHSKIKKYELSIDKAEENIKNNIKEQNTQKEMIKKQKLVIVAVEDRIKKIK
jgi:predicted  nucleic acid-binding Zn-ribbon protein